MTRIRAAAIIVFVALACGLAWVVALPCLLYTSDAADE